MDNAGIDSHGGGTRVEWNEDVGGSEASSWECNFCTALVAAVAEKLCQGISEGVMTPIRTCLLAGEGMVTISILRGATRRAVLCEAQRDG